MASALSPIPDVETTVPSPNLLCVTRSPASSDTTGPPPTMRSPSLTAALLDDGAAPKPPELIGRATGSSRFHSIKASGISSRNRDAGLYAGVPHADRLTARVR